MGCLKLVLVNFAVFVAFLVFGTAFIAVGFHVFEKFYLIDYTGQNIARTETERQPDPEDPFPAVGKYNNFYYYNGAEEPIWENHLYPDGSEEYNVIHGQSKILSRKDLHVKDSPTHYIAMGDSQTFGIGVEDDEVYSNLIARELDRVRVYNMGFKGWGPAATFLLFDGRYSNIKNYIPEGKGVLTWLYFPFLSERDVGTADNFSYTNAILPRYVRSNGDLKLTGRFKDSIRTVFQRLSALLRVYDWWDPLKEKYLPELVQKEKERSFRFSARILSELKARYLEEYPGSEFYVLVCDFQGGSDAAVNFLEEAGLVVHDLRDEGICSRPKDFFTEDHMTPRTHQEVADYIKRRILNASQSLK